MAPVLFLFLMTAFAKTLKIVWREKEIPILSVMTASDDNLINGKICSHTPAMFMSKTLTAYKILQCLYVDNGAFLFGTRNDLMKGMDLIYHHFSRFEMEMHIGQGTSQSKTECVLFPPPQFFQHLQCYAAATSTIQQGSHHIQTSNHTTQITEQPEPSLTCPADFPIGCRIIVNLSHPTHAGKGGIVCRHTRKYIMFKTDEHSPDGIRILPKSLAAYHPNEQCKINSSNDDKEHNPGQTERKHKMYDQLDKTQPFAVANSLVSFMQTFGYLGLLISYNLRNDDDITARIAAANASMGALKHVWRNPHLEVYNKYLLFRAIPMNLLLWGAETWLLQKLQLDKLEVFLHQSIQRILKISITTEQEQ
jgi:hypothetical protein